MLLRTIIFLAVLAISAPAIAAGKLRSWTSTDGRTMQAEFVRELDGDVTFLKDGKLIVIRLEKLSERDQEIVKDLSAGKEPANESPDKSNAPADKPGEESATTPEKSKKPITILSRTWTDRFGKKSSGKFVRVDGENVVLNRGTRVITVPFSSLSDGDQEYVREVLISQGKESDIPTGSAAAEGGLNGGSPNGGNRPPAGEGVNPGAGAPTSPPVPEVGRGFPPGVMPPGLPGRAGPGVGPGPGRNGGVGAPPGVMPPVGGIGRGPAGPPIPGGIPGTFGPAPKTPVPGSAKPPGPGNGALEGMPLPGMGPPPTSKPPMSALPGVGGPSGSGAMPPGVDAMPGIGAMPGTRAMPEMGAMPGVPTLGSSGPGLSPGAGPGFPSGDGPSTPSIPNIQSEEFFQCSKCGAKVTKQESLGTSCPHCKATWGFKQDQFGNKTMTSAGRGQVTSIAAIIVVVVLVGVVVFIALFVGIIVAIVKATSSNAPPQVHPQHMPQQRYY